MVKVFVTKEQYNDIRLIEKKLGKKIKESNHQILIPKCVNEQWGVYRVQRCYMSGLRYIYDLDLVHSTENEIEALLYMKQKSQLLEKKGY